MLSDIEGRVNAAFGGGAGDTMGVAAGGVDCELSSSGLDCKWKSCARI